MRYAVVGHVEWGDFVVAPRLPVPGEILAAASIHEGAGGGGAMSALALLSLAGEGAFLTAVGDDERGMRAVAGLRAAGLDVHAAVRADAQRRVVTYLTDDGERTITTLGDRLVPRGADPLPWEALAGTDAVFFTGGDAAALRAARAARVLCATPRAGEVLVETGVVLDAIIGSAGDPGEQVTDEVAARAQLVVLTEGARGGSWHPGGAASPGETGRWAAAPAPARVLDAYGCGDAFAATFTYALAVTGSVARAAAVGARCGAALLGQRAPAVGDLRALR